MGLQAITPTTKQNSKAMPLTKESVKLSRSPCNMKNNGKIIWHSEKRKISELKPEEQLKIIYKIINLVNGKIYIGQTRRNLNKRIKEHLESLNTNGINGAFKKYGIQNFKIEIIDYADTQEKLNKLEKKYIELFKSLSPYGYNLHTGGNSHECSGETKERLRIAGLGRKLTDETKRKMSEIGKRKIFTEITKNRISEVLKGRKHSLEHISHLPQNQIGFHAGEKHPRALFKNVQIIEIKKLINKGIQYKQIGELFNTTNKHIALIKAGFAYKGIE